MRSQLISGLALAAVAAAAPYQPFPLGDGFPKPDTTQLQKIQKQAGGTLGNGPAPADPKSPTVLLDLQVVAFNEIFEVAYFTQLLENVTSHHYKVDDKWEYTYITNLLEEVIAQEELHAVGVNSLLKAFGGTPVEAAEWKFPVDNLQDALDFAGLFTSLVLGALQSVQTDFTVAKSPALVQLLASVIGQEGEQTGFYRAYNGRIPSASPFLTNSNGFFAYNALQQTVVVPGTNKNDIKVPVFDPLTLADNCEAQPKNSTLTFQVVTKNEPTTSQFITYVSGQNLPVVESISNIKSKGKDTYTFDAYFPFDSGFSLGLTVAALTKNEGPFDNATVVAQNTNAGPGLIYIQ